MPNEDFSGAVTFRKGLLFALEFDVLFLLDKLLLELLALLILLLEEEEELGRCMVVSNICLFKIYVILPT